MVELVQVVIMAGFCQISDRWLVHMSMVGVMIVELVFVVVLQHEIQKQKYSSLMSHLVDVNYLHQENPNIKIMHKK